MKKELLGHVSVDSGLIWVGDPCYVLHKDKENKPEAIGKDWSDFCDLLSTTKGTSFTFDAGHEGLGIAITGFGGDGTFPVTAEIDDKTGLVNSVTINFNGGDSN